MDINFPKFYSPSKGSNQLLIPISIIISKGGDGMSVFLVPASQAELDDPERLQRLKDAGRGEVEIIPVSTLDEALAVLEELGGDPLVTVG